MQDMSSCYDLYSLAGEPIVVIRYRHLTICDNNHCASALLDEFYARAEEAAEFNDMRYRDEDQVDPCVYSTFSKLTKGLFGLFDIETVRAGLMLLIRKKYIKAWQIGEIGTEDEVQLKILCDQKAVRQACEPYYTAIQAERNKELAEIRAREAERIAKLPPPPPPPTSEEIAQKQYEEMLTRENKRVEQHVKRAIKAKLHATLTLEQWLETLEYFQWKCAYCQEEEYTLLEHFIPINHEGGTTQSNCVPACHGCNAVKKGWHPHRIPNSQNAARVRQSIERVQQYLTTFSNVEEEDE